MTDTTVIFKYVIRTTKLEYRDIEKLTLTRSGYVCFFSKRPADSFAFSGWGLSRIVAIAEQKGVPVSRSEQRKLPVAQAVVMIATILAIVLGLGIGYAVIVSWR
jgi:hypothetical protein